MKISILFLFLLLIGNCFAATYEVPTTEDLKSYATYELKNIKFFKISKWVAVSYYLPQELTGNLEKVKYFGKIQNKNKIILKSSNGILTCDVSPLEKTVCRAEYENLNIDEAKAEQIINATAKSPEEAIGRIQVMKSFSGEPVGIITY